VEFLTREALISAYPPYGQGGWLTHVENSVAEHLRNSCQDTTSWKAALDAYEGRHAVALMTLHKSKGLEYHTVIFVGLDDDAWWSFNNDTPEAVAGFFVAFTRAKQRVLFTYAAVRGQRRVIAPLYEMLELAGVKPRFIA
jgi:superfamily I DNA/RNA helicase